MSYFDLYKAFDLVYSKLFSWLAGHRLSEQLVGNFTSGKTDLVLSSSFLGVSGQQDLTKKTRSMSRKYPWA